MQKWTNRSGLQRYARVQLQVFISPYGVGEWTHLDFQAMMCGCLVVKPGAGRFATYPGVFVPDDMVMSVHVEWDDLRDKLQLIFQVRDNIKYHQYADPISCWVCAIGSSCNEPCCQPRYSIICHQCCQFAYSLCRSLTIFYDISIGTV